jgi:hypothetical protein
VSAADVPQLALDVDPACELLVSERRGDDRRDLLVGPLPEPQARELATMLLNRRELPPEPGPWRLAIAGGVRTVDLRRRA